MYDLIIIGGGPAGVAAGVYASRKKIKTLLITKNFNGQSSGSEEIQNWIGEISISGIGLAKKLKDHLHAYKEESTETKEGENVISIEKRDGNFLTKTEKGEYLSKAILIATGSARKKLDIPGAKEFENKGITYCASCDGPMFTDKDVAVIGGGNSAFEAASQLLAYAKSVTLLHRNENLKADKITIEKISANPKMKIILNAVPTEVSGDHFVKSITYKDAITEEIKTLPVEGIFVEIGSEPITSFASNLIKLNEYGHIPVNPKNQQTEIPGIWAAGDCTDGLYQQNNIAAGDAVKSLEDIYIFLKTK